MSDETSEVKVEGGEEVSVPSHFKALVEGMEKLTILEANELVKLLEKKWGVSAAAVAVAGPAAAGCRGCR